MACGVVLTQDCICCKDEYFPAVCALYPVCGMVRYSDLKTTFRELFRGGVLTALVLYCLEISGVIILLNFLLVTC